MRGAVKRKLAKVIAAHPPAKPDTPTEPTGDAEQCVMVCPQCDGEGFYADGLDEAACSTECTRCGSNGWIVDLSALRSHPASDGAVERLAPAIEQLTNHQTQLDMDGVMVGVSRQALEEVLSALT